MASCSGVGVGAGVACPANRIVPEKASTKTANLQQIIFTIGNLISERFLFGLIAPRIPTLRRSGQEGLNPYS
jgi:hypothetical protein